MTTYTPPSFARKLTCVFALLACLSFAHSALAQSWTGETALGIKVLDRKGKPVEGAQVMLLFVEREPFEGPEAVLTDAEGFAQGLQLAAGRWRIDVKEPGFASYTVVVRIQPGKKPAITAGPIRDAVAPPLRVQFLKSPKVSERTRARPDRARPPVPAPVAPPAEPEPPQSQPVEPQPVEPQPPVSEEPDPTEPPAPPVVDPPAPGPPPATEPPPAPRPPAPETPVEQPPVEEPPLEQPPLEQPPKEEPPLDESPIAEPPVEKPSLGEAPIVEDELPPPAPPVRAPVTTGAPRTLPPPAPPTVVQPPVPSPPTTAPPVRQQPVRPRPGPVPPVQLPTVPVPSDDPPAEVPPAREVPPQPTPEPVGPAAVAAEEAAAEEAAAAEVAAERAAPPALPAQPVAPAPPVEGPPGLASQRREVRGFNDAACPGCKPGDWAMVVEQVAPASTGKGGCPRNLERLAVTLNAFADQLGDRLSEVDGPILELLPDSQREELSRFLGPDSSCQLVAAPLPAGARFSGFAYEVRDASGGGECAPAKECTLEGSRWAGLPVAYRTTGGTLVYALFENQSRERPRTARLIVYFKPPRDAR